VAFRFGSASNFAAALFRFAGEQDETKAREVGVLAYLYRSF